MADSKLLTLIELATTPANDDELYIVDTSDTTDDPTGSSKRITFTNLIGHLALSSVLSAHTSDTANPHTVTKTQIGLSNVTDDAQIPLAQKGANSGVAELDGSGLVPTAQLPSYVDDVETYADFASLPGTGETSKIYITEDTNLTYRWSGAVYVEISASLALGETSATAYRGDRGKTAYDHSQVTTGNPHAVALTDFGVTSTSSELNKLDGATISTTELNLLAGLTVLSGSNTGDETTATDTTEGIVELATVAEVDTGTDTSRAITPDVLAGSNYGEKGFSISVFESTSSVTVGNGTNAFTVPSTIDGWNLVEVTVSVYAKGITGTTDVQVRARTGGVDSDMLSTKVTVGDEFFASDGVIDTANDDVSTGDQIYIDRDSIHSGTAPLGLSATLMFRKP